MGVQQDTTYDYRKVFIDIYQFLILPHFTSGYENKKTINYALTNNSLNYYTVKTQ